MRSWRECKLGDIANYRTGKLNSNAATENGEYPFFTCSPITAKINNFAFDEEALLLAGNNANGIFSLKYYQGKFNAYQRTYVINTAEDYKFLFYSLKLQLANLMHMSQGTATKFLTLPILNSIEISLPPLEEQKAIAEVLSSLDDKIDLLHRQNQTLESLAQTLFRQWFIEEAKEEWEEIKLGDYLDCITGYSYKSDDLNDSKNALVTLKNFARDGSFRLDGFKEFTGTKYKDSQIVKHGDLVVSHTDITQEADIIGNPALVVDIGKYDNLIITMDLMKVESKANWLSKEFLYYLFKTEDFKFHCLGNSNGTTVLHMSRKTIPEYKTKIPSIERIEEFTNDVKEILQKQYVNILQIQTLENLRDTLLPKLLSGEVRVEI